MLSPNCRAKHEKWTSALRDELTKRYLNIINMFLSIKNMIFHSPLLQNATQTLTPPSPPPMTTGGYREQPLLVVEPPHQEERFNQSGILRIPLKDSVEKIPSILPFVASLR